MNASSIPSGISFTAIQVAGEREREASRPDALFHDPLAAATTAYVRKVSGSDGPSPDMTPNMRWAWGDLFALRTRFLDEQVLSAVRAGVFQVVNLAAGMDGRAYRLDWPPGVRMLDFDRPGMLGFKRQVVRNAGLSATVDLVAVPGDLNDDWPRLLHDVGFAASQPTVWLAEGILPYFDQDGANRLIQSIGGLSAPRSRFLGDYAVGDHAAFAARGGRDTDSALADILRLFKSGPAVDPWTWMSGHGWKVAAVTVAEWAARLGRPVPRCADPELDGATGYFVNAVRP